MELMYYLRYRWAGEGIRTSVVWKSLFPTCAADDLLFLGCAGYYRKFIRLYDGISHPSLAWLRRNVQFQVVIRMSEVEEDELQQNNCWLSDGSKKYLRLCQCSCFV